MKNALTPVRVKLAVDIHARSYRLLLWMSGALEQGLIAPDLGGAYTSVAEAARGWINKHVKNFPLDARPPEGELEAFANYFASYLSSSFDLDTEPGSRLNSADAHRSCPVCSWIVRRKHLRPKKVGSRDKRGAQRLIQAHLRQVALDENLSVSDRQVEALIADAGLREPLALCAYIVELQQRMQGRSAGACGLALWRTIAWNQRGSPKPKFKLQVAAVLDAHERILQGLSRPT